MATVASLRERRRAEATRPPVHESAPRRVLDSEGRDPPLLQTILMLYAALVVVVTVVMTLAFVIPYLVV